jgi:hypothetical protein
MGCKDVGEATLCVSSDRRLVQPLRRALEGRFRAADRRVDVPRWRPLEREGGEDGEREGRESEQHPHLDVNEEQHHETGKAVQEQDVARKHHHVHDTEAHQR